MSSLKFAFGFTETAAIYLCVRTFQERLNVEHRLKDSLKKREREERMRERDR